MTRSKISQSVLTKISEENITPHSRAYFWSQNIAIISGGIMFLLFGIISLGIVFHFSNNLAFLSLIWNSPRLIIKALWFGLPVLWVIGTIAGTCLTLWTARHTKKGYKISAKMWLIIILGLQIGGGFALEQSPLGEQIDRQMSRRLSFHQTRDQRRQHLWNQVDSGFLGGKIIDVIDQNTIKLKHPTGTWTISLAPTLDKHAANVSAKGTILFIGEKTGNFTFRADQAQSWEPKHPPHKRKP